MTIPNDITYLAEIKLTEFYALVTLMRQICEGRPGTDAEMQFILKKIDRLVERTMVVILKDMSAQGVDLTEMDDPRAREFLAKHKINPNQWDDIIGE
jgi:hypothetical protein